MNFLDLSAVSEEERQLITNLLADTSVVNFVADLDQSVHSSERHHQQQQPLQHRHHQNQNHQQQQQQAPLTNAHLNGNHHNATATTQSTTTTATTTNTYYSAITSASEDNIASNCSNSNSNNNTNFVTPNNRSTPSGSNRLVGNQHQHQQQQQQQQRKGYQHQQQQHSKSGDMNNVASLGPNSTLSAANNNYTNRNENLTNNTRNINNINNNYTSNNRLAPNNNSSHQRTNWNSSKNDQVYQHQHQQQHQQHPQYLQDTKQHNTQTNQHQHYQHHQQQHQPQQRHTDSVVTTTAPVSTANLAGSTPQMAPMAGDMNPVINMDMNNSSQPQGYAIQAHPHVAAAFPPPPHVYGGTPIFHQPYHYLIPYSMPPPYVPYVLPPNSVVPPRHQVPPTMSGASNPHPRSQPHHQPQQQQIQQQPQQQQQIHHQPHQRPMNGGGPNHRAEAGATTTPTLTPITDPEPNEQPEINETIDAEEEVAVNQSKDSHEEVKEEENEVQGKASPIEVDNQEEPQVDTEAQNSASSKSWASLFKRKREVDHNTASEQETSDDENKPPTSAVSGPTPTTEPRPQGSSDKIAQDKMAPKLAQKINSINLKHALPFLKLRGFINKGNGCYINATLQALIACPPFYNLMREIGDLKVSGRENSCTPILDGFSELIQNFPPPLDASKKNKQTTGPQDSKSSVSNLQAEAMEPKCIYNILGQIKPEYHKGAQEDAEEFLSSVLNGLHEEMIALSEALADSNDHNGHPSDIDDDQNNDDNLWREVGPRNRSLPIRSAKVVNTPIQEIFGGSLFSVRTARKDSCGHRSPFFDLQLDISGDNVKSVQDAIVSFTALETIQDFYCSKTRQKLDAQCRTSLDQLPPILILHLKQFVYTPDHGLKKLMKKIEYPIDFEIPEICLHEKPTDKSKISRSYKLLAGKYTLSMTSLYIRLIYSQQILTLHLLCL